MNEDLLANNFVDNVDKLLLKKTFLLSKLILIIVMAYAVIEIVSWYFIISSYPLDHVFISPLNFYTFRIQPLVAITILTMSIIAWLYFIRAGKLVGLSFEKADADIFNAGYLLYNKALRFVALSFITGIIALSLRLFLK